MNFRDSTAKTLAYVRHKRWKPSEFASFTLTLMTRILLRFFLGKEKRDREGWLLRLRPFSASSYEPEVYECVKHLHGNIFVDVGASRGQYAFRMAKRFRQVYAFEPLPENIEWLRREIATRCEGKSIILLPFAVSDRVGQAQLHINPKNVYGSSSLLGNSARKVAVLTITLADIFQTKHLDLVKVDVEGAEWLVLSGAEPIMDEIQRWVIELHDMSRKQELERYLSSHGYSIKWLDVNHIYAWRN
jgi:FkbM family methyltransferase